MPGQDGTNDSNQHLGLIVAASHTESRLVVVFVLLPVGVSDVIWQKSSCWYQNTLASTCIYFVVNSIYKLKSMTSKFSPFAQTSRTATNRAAWGCRAVSWHSRWFSQVNKNYNTFLIEKVETVKNHHKKLS